MKTHHYQIQVSWVGNQGEGTANYRAYSRNHDIIAAKKTLSIPASADPAFLGDKTRYNPEELFLSSLSACHMLWYLHLCSVNTIVVTHYEDSAIGRMEEAKDGSGKFTSVMLRPSITIKDAAKLELAHSLHHEANKMCFIANSCNFSVKHEPRIIALNY